MEKGLGKKRQRRRKCRHCGQLYHPDARNRRHQRYCSQPPCGKASKAESQRRWLHKEENRDYFRGVENTRRVQQWRKAHPGYWKRSRGKGTSTLQDYLTIQDVEDQSVKSTLRGSGLQDLYVAQVPLMVGLIAHLTDSTLQEQIATTTQALVVKGQDILRGDIREQKELQSAYDHKKSVVPSTAAAGSGTVQLDRSALRARGLHQPL